LVSVEMNDDNRLKQTKDPPTMAHRDMTKSYQGLDRRTVISIAVGDRSKVNIAFGTSSSSYW
jgi:hypothetical protein